MKCARIASLLLCLHFFSLSTPSHAAFWEISITGMAITPDGGRGIEVARYVWDPAQIETCVSDTIFPSSCPDVPGHSPGSVIWEMFGPVSFSYFGLVSGTGTGLLRAAISMEASVAIGNSGCICHWVLYPYNQPFETTEVLDQDLMFFGGFGGGEDGWRWEHNVPPTDQLDRYQIVSVRQIAAVSEPGTTVLLGLAFLIIIAKIASRNKRPLRKSA